MSYVRRLECYGFIVTCALLNRYPSLAHIGISSLGPRKQNALGDNIARSNDPRVEVKVSAVVIHIYIAASTERETSCIRK